MTGTKTSGNPAEKVVAIGVAPEHADRLGPLLSSTPCDNDWCVAIQGGNLDPRSIERLIDHSNRQRIVSPVTPGMKLEKNKIYINAQNEGTSVDGNTLTTIEIDPSKTDQINPVDAFLASLSSRPPECTVGVLMSGTGVDGINGATTLHASGAGVLIHPDVPPEIQAQGIDPSYCALGPIVPATSMPDMINTYFANANTPPIEITNGIQEFIARKTNLDIGSYDSAMIARRILCRQRLGGHGTIEAYRETLQSNPTALQDLYHDLLGGVTQFYRDPQAIQALRTLVLDAFAARTTTCAPIRIWIPACFTGEEAYTIAIELSEAFRAANTEGNFRIIATDINRRAIDHASTGIFHPAALHRLSPTLRDRYFTRQNGLCVAKPSLRQRLIFAVQDTLTDPPYLDLDLVSCRNLLPLLNRDARSRVVSMFKFGLNKSGHLFLGPTETLGDHNDDFTTLNKRWRLYQKLSHT